MRLRKLLRKRKRWRRRIRTLSLQWTGARLPLAVPLESPARLLESPVLPLASSVLPMESPVLPLASSVLPMAEWSRLKVHRMRFRILMKIL